jgi:uncharacterized membrane protein (TIGR02234 family)
VSRRGGYVTALLLIAIGAAVLLLSTMRPWWTVTVTSAGTPATTEVVDGRHAASATVGLAVLGLAGIAGVLATKGLWRRLVGAIVALAGLAAALAAQSATGKGGWQGAVSVSASPTITLTATHSAWPYVALAAAVLMLIGGALVAAFGGRWPGWSSRYDAPSAASGTTAATEPTAHDLWDALDRGEDPTASPDVPPRRDLPE